MPFTRRDFLKLSSAALGGILLTPVTKALALGRPPYIKFGDSETPQVSLTFDDCYHVKELQQLETLLDSFPNIKLTFFAVGTALLNTSSKDPEIWQRLIHKGHEIGYHSFQHDNLWTLSDQKVLDDYEQWYEALATVLGHEPKVSSARPPFGNRSVSFERMCKARNLTVAMWSASWGGPTDKAKLAMQKVQNGDIILMHITYQDLLNAKVALPFLTLRGLPSVTVTQLASEREKQFSRIENCNPVPDNSSPICID